MKSYLCVGSGDGIQIAGLPSFYLLSHLAGFFFYTSKITFARAPPMVSHYIAQAGLDPLNLSDPPVSTSKNS